MAYEIPGFTFTLEAGADLSALQFYFVKMDANGKAIPCTAATDIPVGVLQNKPQLAENCDIMVNGISKMAALNSTATLALIGPAADGRADAKVAGTDITEYVCGRVLEGNTAGGGLITALIDCAAPHRAA